MDNEFLNLICKPQFQISLYWAGEVGYQQYVTFTGTALVSSNVSQKLGEIFWVFWQI